MPVRFFTKAAGLTPGNLLKKRLWHRCLKIGTGIFKNKFWQNTCGGCFYRTSPRRLIYIPFTSCVRRNNKLSYFYLRLFKFSDLKKKAKRVGKNDFSGILSLIESPYRYTLKLGIHLKEHLAITYYVTSYYTKNKEMILERFNALEQNFQKGQSSIIS